FKEHRTARGVDAKVERKTVVEPQEPREPRAGVEDFGDRPLRPPVILSAQIDHPGDERRRPKLAKAAAPAKDVFRTRQRLIVLHGEKGAAGLARFILDDPLDAELVGKIAAEIDETHPHVVSLDERLDERAVVVALENALRAAGRLVFALAQAVGEN